MRSGWLACLVVIVVSACSTQKPTETACVVAHESGFAGTAGNQEHITVARNASRCVIDMTAGRSQPGFGGEIATQPQHGTAEIRATAYSTLIAYTPERDYVGPDSFKVVFSADFNVTILVTVVPLTN